MTLIPPATRWKVIQRDRHACQWCGAQIDFEQSAEYTIWQRSTNGSREKWQLRPSNLVLVCVSCADRLRAHPDTGHASGFTVTDTQPSWVPIRTHSRGVVLLTDSGGCESQQVSF